jgi:hypothetical protein
MVHGIHYKKEAFLSQYLCLRRSTAVSGRCRTL